MIIKSLFEQTTRLPEAAYDHYTGIFASVILVDAKTPSYTAPAILMAIPYTCVVCQRSIAARQLYITR
jgi:hypothetical protein